MSPRIGLRTFRVGLERLLLVWLVVLCAVAYLWGGWFGTGALDPFVASRKSLPYLIMVTMFAIGSLLPMAEIRQVARRWPMVLAGTAVQYSAMPLLAWGMGRLFGLEHAWMVGMQNAGLGTTLARGLFPDTPAAALPAALYTFGCMLTGTILARAWAELGSRPAAAADQ